MTSLRFVGGVFDGITLSFAGRTPDQVEFTMPCLPHDTMNPAHQEAIGANLSPDEVRDAVFVTNAESYSYRYTLGYGDEGEPDFFEYAGWSIRGRIPQ